MQTVKNSKLEERTEASIEAIKKLTQRNFQNAQNKNSSIKITCTIENNNGNVYVGGNDIELINKLLEQLKIFNRDTTDIYKECLDLLKNNQKHLTSRINNLEDEIVLLRAKDDKTDG